MSPPHQASRPPALCRDDGLMFYLGFETKGKTNYALEDRSFRAVFILQHMSQNTFVSPFRSPHPRQVELLAPETPHQCQCVGGNRAMDSWDRLCPLGLDEGWLQKAQCNVISFWERLIFPSLKTYMFFSVGTCPREIQLGQTIEHKNQNLCF